MCHVPPALSVPNMICMESKSKELDCETKKGKPEGNNKLVVDFPSKLGKYNNGKCLVCFKGGGMYYQKRAV